MPNGIKAEDRLTKGAPWVPPRAVAWNQMLDVAAATTKSSQIVGGVGIRRGDRGLWVRITGAQFETAFSVTGLGEPAVSVGDSVDALQQPIVFQSAVPTTDNWVVCPYGLDNDDGLYDALYQGMSWAEVTVVDTGHEYVSYFQQSQSLQTATSGLAKLMVTPTSTGLQWVPLYIRPEVKGLEAEPDWMIGSTAEAIGVGSSGEVTRFAGADPGGTITGKNNFFSDRLGALSSFTNVYMVKNGLEWEIVYANQP